MNVRNGGDIRRTIREKGVEDRAKGERGWRDSGKKRDYDMMGCFWVFSVFWVSGSAGGLDS